MEITRKKLFIISLVILIVGIICMVCTNHVVSMDANETYKRFSDNFVNLMIGVFGLGMLLQMMGGIGLVCVVWALAEEHIKFNI